MSLNIKNPRVHELAREAARRSGQSQTAAIESALEAYLRALVDEDDLKRDQRSRRAADMDEALAAVHACLTDADRDEIRRAHDTLYDEHGLPA